jgi:long-subunit acyl-CoA synthetase (AMP-forming)
VTAHVETIPALFQARVRMSVSRVALRQFDPASNEAGNPLTWGAWYDAARDVAGALIAWRIERRATVAILAANRLLWPIADLGSAFAGLASAGMHTTSTESQLRSLLTDCGARVLIVDSLEQLAKARAAVAGPDQRSFHCTTTAPATCWPGTTGWKRGAKPASRAPWPTSWRCARM